jgi:hypothetical protein
VDYEALIAEEVLLAVEAAEALPLPLSLLPPLPLSLLPPLLLSLLLLNLLLLLLLLLCLLRLQGMLMVVRTHVRAEAAERLGYAEWSKVPSKIPRRSTRLHSKTALTLRMLLTLRMWRIGGGQVRGKEVSRGLRGLELSRGHDLRAHDLHRAHELCMIRGHELSRGHDLCLSRSLSGVSLTQVCRRRIERE